MSFFLRRIYSRLCCTTVRVGLPNVHGDTTCAVSTSILFRTPGHALYYWLRSKAGYVPCIPGNRIALGGNLW